MLKENLNYCEKLTKMNQNSQNQKLRLFAKVDIANKLKILEYQKQLFHKIKSAYSDVNNIILTFSSLILAIDKFEKEIDSVNLNSIKLKGGKVKGNIKRQKVLGYWAIVRTLKLDQKMSFREISAYFAKYHKLKVSYSTIYELWNELENNIKRKEN